MRRSATHLSLAMLASGVLAACAPNPKHVIVADLAAVLPAPSCEAAARPLYVVAADGVGEPLRLVTSQDPASFQIGWAYLDEIQAAGLWVWLRDALVKALGPCFASVQAGPPPAEAGEALVLELGLQSAMIAIAGYDGKAPAAYSAPGRPAAPPAAPGKAELRARLDLPLVLTLRLGERVVLRERVAAPGYAAALPLGDQDAGPMTRQALELALAEAVARVLAARP